MTICYCGGHYRCEICRRDVCFCNCPTDPTPETQAAVTAGYIDPTAAHAAAWEQKLELTR